MPAIKPKLKKINFGRTTSQSGDWLNFVVAWQGTQTTRTSVTNSAVFLGTLPWLSKTNEVDSSLMV